MAFRYEGGRTSGMPCLFLPFIRALGYFVDMLSILKRPILIQAEEDMKTQLSITSSEASVIPTGEQRICHSEAIEEDEKVKYGCFTTLDARRSLALDVSDDALATLKHEWARKTTEVKAMREPGLENRYTGNCVALALPEAIPARLWHVTYLSGLTFHLDGKFPPLLQYALPRLTDADITEVMECCNVYQDLVRDFDQPLDFILASSDHNFPSNSTEAVGVINLQNPQSSFVRDLLRPIVNQMLSLDPVNALAVLAAWTSYFASLGSRPKQQAITMEEYIPHRLRDFGCDHWLAMLRFSMDIHISAEEMRSVDRIANEAMVSVVLTNDWHSWPKELKAHQDRQAKLCNAVAVLMKMHSTSAERAHELLRTMAISAEQKYTDLRKQWLASNASASADLARYVDAVGLLAAGASVWSASCPRYNSRRNLDIL